MAERDAKLNPPAGRPGEAGAETLALWVLHTYCLEATFVSPFLTLSSPEKRCGKTTLLTLLSVLVRRPLTASNVSPAAVFRSIERWQPTLLIDEGDSFLRGILNSGHTRSTAFVVRTVGDQHEPCRFSTWAPKAIALIGQMADTLADRAIQIRMRRKTPQETARKLRLDRLDALAPLPRRCQRWALDHRRVRP